MSAWEQQFLAHRIIPLLYSNSVAFQRKKKEQDIAELFAKRFEAALEKLAEGLHKKGTVERYDKVLERLGRLRQKYARAAHYYEVSVEQDPASGKATRAEPRQQVVYDALGIRDRPGQTEKTIA